MTTLPQYNPFYGGGQVANPANVIEVTGLPTYSALTTNRIGTIGVDNATGVGYMLVSKSGGTDTWSQIISGGGGAGSFTTLTNTVAYTLGTAQVTHNSTIGSGQSSGTIIIGGSAATGTITLGSSSGTQIVNVGTGAGANAVNVGVGGTGIVTIGNTTGNTAVTGSLTASTGLTATTGGVTVVAGGIAATGNSTINSSGAGTTIIGTGGTGYVHIGNATGNTAVTGSLTASAGLVATTAGVTATAGNITATNGNVILSHAATYIGMKATAVTDFAGVSQLTSGTVEIPNTNIAAGDLIFIQRLAENGSGASTTLGELTYVITAGNNFTVNSLILDTPASVETGDNSSFVYFIIRPQ